MWIYSFLILKLLVFNDAVVIFPRSPCPNDFYYEDTSTEGDRWYGTLNYTVQTVVTGTTVRITLTRASNLLVTWQGAVISKDNQVYIMFNQNERIKPNTNFIIKMMVTFDPSSLQTPFLQTIHFNGRRICPPDSPLTLSSGDNGPGFRPDPDFSEHNQRPDDTTVTKPSINYENYACGQVDMATPLITHGAQTYKGQWPWHVALYRSEGVNLNYKCGATLVSRNKVITAAHCVTTGSVVKINVVSSNSVILYLGKHKLHQFIGEDGIQTKQVTQIQVHPDYNMETFYGDMAVLTMSTNAEFTTLVRPVCLWGKADSTSDIEGKEGSVVGWGLDENERTVDDLKVARMPVVSTEMCLRSFPQFYSQFTSNGTFCAGFRNGTSPCNGDSGGGIVFNRNSTWYLRGVVSLSVAKEGLNFCDPKYYVIFSDVAKFSEFINKNL